MKFWQRHRRALRLTLTWGGAIFVVYLAGAWFFGVGDGSGNTTPVSPATATRNVFSFFPTMLRTVLPSVLQFVAYLFVLVFQFVLLFGLMSRGRTYTLFPGEYDLSFDDVRGQPHIVDSTKQVMTLFQGFKEFRKIGGHPPHGILFEGPPGTGKTLLAKAIAGESGVPFVYASGASFAGPLLGMGNLRVQRMFSKARKFSERYGGCVIFIDELDSIGESRSRGMGGGGGIFGGAGLVNELLTQMDGIDQPRRFRRFVRRTFRRGPKQSSSNYNLLVVAATNRASALDPALVRPGRFDRKIHVGNPGEEGRKDIIAYYLNKVAHVPLDVDRVANATAGYSPAGIKNIINEALIYALQDGRRALTYDDIWKAKLTDEVGLVEPVEYSDTVKAATAIHEAGHAIVGYLLRPWLPVQIITVRKRGDALGLVHAQFEEDNFRFTKSQFLADIKVSLAGMVAEEMWLGESGTGPAGDLQSATGRAFAMVTRLGMGSQLASLSLLEDGRENDVATAMRDPQLRREIDQVLQECKTEVRRILEEHRKAMEAVRDALMARDELTGDEFLTLLWQVGTAAEPPKVLAQLPVHGSNGNGRNGHGPQVVAGFPGIPADTNRRGFGAEK